VFYQKDGEPLESKPQLFMTFNAVQALLALKASVSCKSLAEGRRTIVDAHLQQIETSLAQAGAFVERLLAHHADRDGFIRMSVPIRYTDAEDFISYRHTTGSAIVLALLGSQSSKVYEIVEKLVSTGLQNRDRGWPIANRIYTGSDILCSIHTAYLFSLALHMEDCRHLEKDLRRMIATTLAFLTIQNDEGEGLWIYDDEVLTAVPFTARTYPEFCALAEANGSELIDTVPATLVRAYPLANRSKYAAIENTDQLLVRLAYAFKFAAMRDKATYLETYLHARASAIASYTDEKYYSTYEFCCLLMMLLDDVAVGSDPDSTHVTGWLHDRLWFFGNLFHVDQKWFDRARENGLLPRTNAGH